MHTELLIAGHGDPVRGGVVLLDGSRIGYAGPAVAAPETPGAPRLRRGHGHARDVGSPRATTPT